MVLSKEMLYQVLFSPQLKEGPTPYSLHLGIVQCKFKCVFSSSIIKNVKLYRERKETDLFNSEGTYSICLMKNLISTETL